MSRHDWYRRVTWTKADEEEFMAKYNRARSDFNKAQYLRIQALYLQKEANPPLFDKSLKLLDMLLDEYPESSEAAGALLQKAQCLESLGKITEASSALLESLVLDQKTSQIKTRAPLEFARFVVKYELKEHYQRAANVLLDSEMLTLFPEGKYLANSALAIISEERGRLRKARKYATLALKAINVKDSGLHLRPEVGLVQNPDEEVLARLRKIAGS